MISSNTHKSTKRQDWALVALRWLFLIGISLAIFVARSLSDEPAGNYEDVAIAFGIGAAITMVLSVSAWLPSFNAALPILLNIEDAVLAGLYVYIADGDPMILVAVAGFLAMTGLLRLGSMWGGLHALIVVAIALGTGIYVLIENSPTNDLDLDQATDLYALPAMASGLLALGAGVWIHFHHGGHDAAALEKLDKAIKEHQGKIAEMQNRTRAISDMTEALSSSLNFNKVLDAALDFGQLSMYSKKGQRIVSVVLLFRSDDAELYVASSRGMKPTDEHVVIQGMRGLVAKALDECVPVIGGDITSDPELRKFVGFHGMKSSVCVPLHAHFDNFGVLVYASNVPNAFREDAIDILTIIGVQCTTALQNAVLYNTLMDEKELILQLEEDARKSLVRDLHDIPTQTISAVTMRLRIIKRMMGQKFDTIPPDIAEELDTVEDMAQRATEEIRHVLFKLRPLALETQGLIAALDQLAEKMEQTYKQPCTMRIHPDVQHYLEEAKQGAMFYLIEEAINNARKYARASMITVQAVPKDQMINLTITDNGKGFDPDSINKSYSSRGSFGMVNMKERADMLDGVLTINSQKGQGTTIRVQIPIDTSKPTTATGSYRQVPTTKLAATAKSRLEEL